MRLAVVRVLPPHPSGLDPAFPCPRLSITAWLVPANTSIQVVPTTSPSKPPLPHCSCEKPACSCCISFHNRLAEVGLCQCRCISPVHQQLLTPESCSAFVGSTPTSIYTARLWRVNERNDLTTATTTRRRRRRRRKPYPLFFPGRLPSISPFACFMKRSPPKALPCPCPFLFTTATT